MACRVFRNTIFGRFRETEISTSLISRELKGAVVSLPLWGRGIGHGSKQGDDSFAESEVNKDTQKVDLQVVKDCEKL